MGLFDVFKKKSQQPIRDFTSDATSFTVEEIRAWMKSVASSSDVVPKTKSEEYVRSLIERIGIQKDITILEDTTNDSVRLMNLAIERKGTDYVSLSYLLSDPNVVYITTAPFGFAGDAISFMNYCNSFQGEYPMIAIGVKDFENEIKLPDGSAGTVSQPMYSLRTCLPLLGNEKDIDNLLTIVKTLPIYGYDLRDGYHTGNPQPYSVRRGSKVINKQLYKIEEVHQFKKEEGLYPAEIALYGHGPFMKVHTEKPAKLPNPFLQALDMESSPRSMFSSLSTGEGRTVFFKHDTAQEEGSYDGYANLSLICYTDYPTLYTLEKEIMYKVQDVDVEVPRLLLTAGDMSFPIITLDPHGQYLTKMSLLNGKKEDEIIVRISMTFCLPNIVDAKNIGYQLANFLSLISFPLEKL